MKKLSLEQMEHIEGGLKVSSLVGIFCGATLVFACSGVLAPLAGATGVGCAVGLYAESYWEKQGLIVDWNNLIKLKIMEKVLSIEDMSQTNGGKFWDGFCVVVGIANFASPLLAFSGVGYVVVKAAGLGCLIYAASEL